MVRDIAQTNLQLYDQLLGLGFEERALVEVRAAYELACDLFTGRFRPSGKTFVAHVVGTASVVADAGGRSALVSAGLLHAAYQQGDFGPGRDEGRHRSVVRAVVGSDAERVIFEYARTPWDPVTIDRLRGDVVDLSTDARDVLFVRLANEVDEHADYGAEYAPRNGAPLFRDDVVASMIDLAIELDNPQLAGRLRQVRRSERADVIPAVLRSSATGSILRPPASYGRRIRSWTNAARRRLGRELLKVPGVQPLRERLQTRGGRCGGSTSQ